MTAWHETDDFWLAVEPAMFSETRLAHGQSDVTAVVGLLGLEPPARVLDLCTGPGRHALELARRGFAVTGVDRTKPYLERARAAAESESLEVELVEADMRDFVRESAFDAAINMFSSIGYFDDPRADLRVLTNLRRSLAPGGRALLEMSGREVLAKNFNERGWTEAGGVLMAEERRVRPGWEWVDARWIVVREGVRKEFDVSVRQYTASELASMLREAGFARVSVFGALDGRPYDHLAQRLVAVAHAD